MRGWGEVQKELDRVKAEIKKTADKDKEKKLQEQAAALEIELEWILL